MQKSSRATYYARRVAGYTKHNAALLVFAVLFLFGVLCATLAFGLLEPQPRQYITDIATDFANTRLTAQLQRNFVSAASSALLFPAVMLICGFCAVAQPIIAAAPFVRGLGVGFMLAALYAHYGASAVGFGLLYIVSVLPVSAALMLCAVESLRLSAGIFSAMRTGERSAFYPVRRYLAKYLAVAVLCLLSSAMEAILYEVFANYVVLG